MKKSSILTSMGTLLAALGAFACCWLPLALLAFGASAAAVGSVVTVLEAYRPAFVAAAVALLGTAWYVTYFRKTGASAAGTDHGCCEAPSPAASVTAGNCSCCGKPGKRVPDRTVRAMVKEFLKGSVVTGDYLLCPNPACAQVYTGPTGSRCFLRQDLAVRVGFKEAEAPHPICYCFDHTVEAIEEELRATGATSIPDRIRAEVKAGRCACATRNPHGACCLGDVARAVRGAQDRLAGKETAPVGAPATQCAPPPVAGESDEACCAPSSAKGGIRKANRVLLPVFTPLVLAMVLFPDRVLGFFVPGSPATVSSPFPVSPSLPAAPRHTVTLRVPGMT